jgi:hypothetical protein
MRLKSGAVGMKTELKSINDNKSRHSHCWPLNIEDQGPGSMSHQIPSFRAGAPLPERTRTISLQREVRPTSSPGRSIRHSPVFCGYCLNLYGLSAEELLPSFNVSLKQTHKTLGQKTWEFSVLFADVLRESAAGCASCTLLKAAVELATPAKYQGQDLGLTVEFRDGCVLRGEVYNLLPEDERETEFALGGSAVEGAVSGMFDGLVERFDLYTLPGA